MISEQTSGIYTYNVKHLRDLIGEIVKASVTPDAWKWLEGAAALSNGVTGFNASFVLLPRKTGKAGVRISQEQLDACSTIRRGFSIEGWSIDRLSRVWLLMHLDPSDKDNYQRIIENLFLAAEMNELVALYSALPLLAYPAIWVKRCAEGIRNTMDSVLEAVMYNNPYPSDYLEQPAWNQMILKAFFTGKKIEKIEGLDERANSELAHTLSDYAQERWAAKREMNPMLWRLVGRFIDDEILSAIKKGLQVSAYQDKRPIVLAIVESSYEPAKALLEDPELKAIADDKTLSWKSFESPAN
ncbi:MAG TPA: EboA domain-containing protein [Sphingobacteriaceae bacterium]